MVEPEMRGDGGALRSSNALLPATLRAFPRRVLAGLAVVLALLGCSRTAADGQEAFPRRETFALGGLQWGEPSSFNPFAVNPDWPVKTPCNLLYQTLLMFDAQAGELRPLLAQAYRQLPEGIEVTLDPRARFSDGAPVTAEDVQYSFELGKSYPGIPAGPLWPYLERVAVGTAEQVLGNSEMRDSGKVTFVFAAHNHNALVVLDALQELRIVPKHVIAPLLEQVHGDISEFLRLRFDHDPVVSGPYQLHSYSSEKIALVRRDDYWGNAAHHGGQLPGPKYIVHPVYKSNDHYSIALQQGRLDMSSAFMPRIWLKRSKGVRSWFEDAPFFVATGIPMVLINVNRAPLQDVRVRRAMALAINYQDIRELAVSGYSEPLQPGLVLPFGPESKYYSKADGDAYGAGRYDPDAARALLAAAGYQPVFDAKGNLLETRDSEGARVPTVYIKSPTGWTDWEAIVRIAVRSMRAVGIDVRERFVDASVFWQVTAAGDFDLIMKLPKPQPSPSMPWSRFESLLTTKGWVPSGEKMYKNEGRFNDPTSPHYLARVDELLDRIPTLGDEAELTAAYRELNVLFMQQQPSLPLVYRPAAFYQVSTKVWTGFPSARDPFLPSALVGEHLGTDILWHLRPAADAN